MDIIKTPNDMRAWARTEHSRGHNVGFVPTMGALHAGHVALIRAAVEEADVVVVSIFVNPLQFDGRADLDHYPRPLDDDIEICSAAGVDIVYAPTAATMYPDGFQTRVLPGRLADVMEGASRAGHFEGVATIVTKLFSAVQPDRAWFGEKDYQQLAIIRQMTADLDLGIEITGHAIVREPDGLAMSSRNAHLSEHQRTAALCLPRALGTAADVARMPGSTVTEILNAAQEVVAAEPQAAIDYVSIFDATSLQPVTDLTPEQRRSGRVRIAGAIKFDNVRLIDNRDLFAN